MWVAASLHVHTVWHGRWTAVRLAAAAMWCTGWCGDVALAVWGVSRFWLCSRSGGTRWEGGSPRVVACQPIARTIMGVSGRLRVTVDTGTVVGVWWRGRVTSVAACDGRCADGARGRRGCGDTGGWARQLAACFKSCTSMFTLHVRARLAYTVKQPCGIDNRGGGDRCHNFSDFATF